MIAGTSTMSEPRQCYQHGRGSNHIHDYKGVAAMADISVIAAKVCVKCGSTERNSNGDCRPCQLACSSAWKAKRKARRAAEGGPRFYTYIHIRADDGKIFYVGKGNGERAEFERGRNRHWERTKAKHGIRVEIVERFASEADAFKHECALIAKYRADGHPLCNYTDGGDGPTGYTHTEETRAKLSAMQIGRKLSAEHRAKLSAVANRGVPRTKEVRERISLANKGKKRTPEQRKRNSEVRRGKPLLPGHCANIAAALAGHPVSAETRAKIGAKHIGMTPSAEVRAKISASNKGRKLTAEQIDRLSLAQTGATRSAESRARMSAAQKGRVINVEQRAKISASLTGRRLSEAEKERRRPLTHSAESRAKHSAVMKGRPWSNARRAAQSRSKT